MVRKKSITSISIDCTWGKRKRSEHKKVGEKIFAFIQERRGSRRKKSRKILNKLF